MRISYHMKGHIKQLPDLPVWIHSTEPSSPLSAVSEIFLQLPLESEGRSCPMTQCQPPAASPASGTHASPVAVPVITEFSLQRAETCSEAVYVVASVWSSGFCPLLVAFDSLVPLCSFRGQMCLLEILFQSQRKDCSDFSQHHDPRHAGHGHTQTPEESWKPKACFSWLLPFFSVPLSRGRISPAAPTRCRKASRASLQIHLRVSSQEPPCTHGLDK